VVTPAGVTKNVAAGVSRLKLSSFAQFFECSAEKNDPAHAGCYETSKIRTITATTRFAACSWSRWPGC